MDVMHYPVTGMTCDGCVRGLTRALGRRVPDLDATVTLAPSEVVVRGDHDVAAVRAAVEAAGYGWGAPPA